MPEAIGGQVIIVPGDENEAVIKTEGEAQDEGGIVDAALAQSGFQGFIEFFSGLDHDVWYRLGDAGWQEAKGKFIHR